MNSNPKSAAFPGGWREPQGTPEPDGDLYDSIRNGDQVTIETRHGNQLKGRAVMLGPGGWVLNLGGPHGTPGIANRENVVAVRKRRASRMARRVASQYLVAYQTFQFTQRDDDVLAGEDRHAIRGILTVPTSILPSRESSPRRQEWNRPSPSEQARLDKDYTFRDDQNWQRAISGVLDADDVFMAWYHKYGDAMSRQYNGDRGGYDEDGMSDAERTDGEYGGDGEDSDLGVEPEYEITRVPGSSGPTGYKIMVNHPPTIRGDKAYIDISFLLRVT